MGRRRTALTFKLVAPDEVRVYRDGDYIGDIFKDEDILNPGRFHYLIWLYEDRRGWKRVTDRGGSARPSSAGSRPTRSTEPRSRHQAGSSLFGEGSAPYPGFRAPHPEQRTASLWVTTSAARTISRAPNPSGG